MIKSFLVYLICFSMYNIASPKSDSDSLDSTIFESPSSQNNPIELLTMNLEYSIFEDITLEFRIDSTIVNSIEINADGIHIVSEAYEHENNRYFIVINEVEHLSIISISYYYPKLLTSGAKTLYFGVLDDTVFVNQLSFDSLNRTILERQLELETITEKEMEESISESFESAVEVHVDTPTLRSSIVSSNNIVFNGHVSWEDDKGDSHDLRFTRVSLMYGVNVVPLFKTKDAYTDEHGNFSFDFNDDKLIPNVSFMLTIASEGTNVSVRPSRNGSAYNTSIIVDQYVNSNKSYEFTIDMSNDFGKAIQVCQAALNAARYASYLDGYSSIPACTVVYPYSGGSEYHPSQKTIYISGIEFNYPTMPKTYASWDVIGHEYAHHIQELYNIEDNPGGFHLGEGNMCDIYRDGYVTFDGVVLVTPHINSLAKSKGVRIAWAEGWASYFSVTANRHYYSNHDNIDTVGDSFFVSSDGCVIDLDSYPDNGFFATGEGCETVISNLLYKMSSSDLTDDADDSVYIDARDIWNSIKLGGFTTLTPFIYDIRSINEGGYYWAIGRLLGRFGVAPSNINISYGDDAFDPPTISWDKGGAGFDYYHNSSFKLTIYDKVLMPYFQKTLTTNSYTPSFSEWEDIKIHGIRRINVEGRDENYYATGPYDSDAPFLDLVSTNIVSSDYGFQELYPFEEVEKQVTLNNSITFKTTRLRTGYIDNECIVLSPRQKNAGTAYLAYSTGFPINHISIDISLWSDSEMLYPHTSFASIQYKDPESDIWMNELNLLTEVTLSTNREEMIAYELTLPNVYEFRVYTTSLQSGTNNKGRLCIGGVVIN